MKYIPITYGGRASLSGGAWVCRAHLTVFPHKKGVPEKEKKKGFEEPGLAWALGWL